MTQDKQLLMADLCARLPYGVKIQYDSQVCKLVSINDDYTILLLGEDGYKPNIEDGLFLNIEKVKPYLRPMSSMTDEERYELRSIFNHDIDFDEMGMKILYSNCNSLSYLELQAIINFFYAHHLDWCDLIPKKLALEAPKEMYEKKEQK